MNQELALNLFQYKDGKLFWKVNPGPWKSLIGKEAGSLNGMGYKNVVHNYKQYSAHRLIYIMHYGEITKGLQIDHLNGNRADNRIENLRACTASSNQQNQTKAKGYYWDTTKKRFRALLKRNRKTIHLGSYYTESAARLAYLMEKLQWNLAHKTV